MSLSVSLPPEQASFRPRIVVLGVGGAGGNAVHNMIRSQLEGVEFMLANTDAQAMQLVPCDHRIQLGRQLTAGLGAGADPNVGHKAAEESAEDIAAALSGTHMVFITAGMGGGTGTGAAPVIANIARQMGILTVGVVTKPFDFEGQRRQRLAEEGIEQMAKHVDTLLVIPNQNLFRVANDQTTFADAFRMADEILYTGVRSISDLMTRPGLVNLDFADVRSLMTVAGKAMLGSGEASGESRAIEAAEAAIFNPLLDDVSINGANGALINVAGGSDMSLFEVATAATRIKDVLAPDANVVFGTSQSSELDGKIRVSLVATGIQEQSAQVSKPESDVFEPFMASGPRIASLNPQSPSTTEAPSQRPSIGQESPVLQPQPESATDTTQPQLASAEELGLMPNPFGGQAVSKKEPVASSAQRSSAPAAYVYDMDDEQDDDDLMNLPGMGPQPSLPEEYEPVAVGQTHGADDYNFYEHNAPYPVEANQPELPPAAASAPQASYGNDGWGQPSQNQGAPVNLHSRQDQSGHAPRRAQSQNRRPAPVQAAVPTADQQHGYANASQQPEGYWGQPDVGQPEIDEQAAEAWAPSYHADVAPDQPNPLRQHTQAEQPQYEDRPQAQQPAPQQRGRGGLGGFASRLLPFGGSQPGGQSGGQPQSAQRPAPYAGATMGRPGSAPGHHPAQPQFGHQPNAPTPAPQQRQPEAWPELVVDNNDLSRMDEELIDIPAFLRRQAN